MAASISADKTRERLGQQLEDLLRSGQYEELYLLLETQLMSRPDDRELRLYQLLFVIKAEGVAAHEREIDGLRNLTELSDREREVIRQIFILGFEEAQREGIKEKSWAYQRLARRLVLHQSLLEPLPRVESSETGDSERRKQAADDSAAPSTRYFAGPNPRVGAFQRQQNILDLRLLVVVAVGLAAVLANYAPMVWNQNRSEVPEKTYLSNEEPAGSAAVSKPGAESATATREGLEFANAPGIAAAELAEHQTLRTTAEAPKAVPLAPNKAKANATNKGGNKEKNISESTVGIKVAELKARKVLPVSEPRKEPVGERPPHQPRDDAVAGAPGTYQVRVDVRLREEPRFGSPHGATIKKGTLISGIDLKRDWLRIKVPSDGSTGFIRKEFVVPVSSTEPR